MTIVSGLTISPTPLVSFPKQLLANWDRKVEIETAYLTAVNTREDGTEKRKGLKVRPRRFISARLTAMDQREIMQLRNFQLRTANQVVPYPIYSDITQVTFAGQDFTGNFTDTRFFDGGRLILFGMDHRGVSDVGLYVISNVTSTTVTVTTTITDPGGGGYYFVAPLIDADIELLPAEESILSDNKMTVDVNVNEKMDESALIPLDTPFTPTTYLGIAIFPFDHNWVEDVRSQISRFGTRIQFGRGRLVSTDSSRPQNGFGLKSLFDREEAFEFIRWFDYCRGRLVPFWIGDPLNLWEVVSIGASTITVKGQGLSEDDINDFFLYMRGVGDTEIMEITNVSPSGDNLIIGSDEIPVGLDVNFLQPVHLARFGKDSIREVWSNRNVCEVSYDIVEILDPPFESTGDQSGGLPGQEIDELEFGGFPSSVIVPEYFGGFPDGTL